MPKTILLADDSVTIQKVVGISFANEDVVLLTVDNGDDAVSRAREARPDLVLADVMMPGRDGYDVCETLKADPELRHVPVLLLSGTFEPYDAERAERVGADGHITKPFEAQALVDQVNALLARATAPTPIAESSHTDATVLIANASDGDPDAAFDFFDDEMARTAPSPARAVPTMFDDDDAALELEAAVDEDDDLNPLTSSSSQPLGMPTAGDSQPTALFAEPEPSSPMWSGRSHPGFLGEDPDDSRLTVPAAEPATRAPSDAPHGYEESFDFGFDDDAAEAPAPPPVTDGPETTPPAWAAAPTGGFATEEVDEPPVPEFATTEPLATRQDLPPIPEPPVPPFATSAPPPVPAAASRTEAPVTIPVAGTARPTALSEPIQKQLQETLEKIVWEAFGDVTERIVRDVIERVEAVAWEVIPQMTETLIREEIRRLHDDAAES